MREKFLIIIISGYDHGVPLKSAQTYARHKKHRVCLQTKTASRCDAKHPPHPLPNIQVRAPSQPTRLQPYNQPNQYSHPPEQPHRLSVRYLPNCPSSAASSQPCWQAATRAYLNFQGDARYGTPPVFNLGALLGCSLDHQ